MLIKRLLSNKLGVYASQFRAVALMGARQCGKTTLTKMLFAQRPYVNFENIDVLQLSQTDPRGFLEKYKSTGAIFDEIQKAPVLFNYLQEILDNEIEKGKYILTGSSNFLLNQTISQSLAGRVGYIEMYPLSYFEIPKAKSISVWQHIVSGGYPELWVSKIMAQLYYPSYIQSFIEKDIRQFINAKNLIHYQRFIKLIASRVSCEWNNSTIAMELGIDAKTVNAWLSFLQLAGIVYLLPPYHTNFGKRVIKRPKFYFADTGIVCSLLGIGNEGQLETHPLKGAIFENYILMELVKLQSFNIEPAQFYFWRSIDGVEIDVIIEKGGKLTPVEIKAGKTYQPDWWRNIDKFNEYAQNKNKNIIIYLGNEELEMKGKKHLLNFKNTDSVVI